MKELASTGQRVYKLRNIWRSARTWDGELSREEDFTSEVMDELAMQEMRSDIIYVTEAELASCFTSMTVCKVRENDETLRIKGEFLKDGSGEQSTLDRGVRSKFQYEVTLSRL